MKGKGWRLFKLISMLLVLAAIACAFALKGFSEQRFWTMLGIVSSVAVGYLLLFLRFEKNIHSFVTEMESQLNITERDSLYKFPAPTVIVDSSGTIIWYNKAFTAKIHPGELFGIPLKSIIDIDMEKLLSSKGNVIEYRSGHYRINALTTEKKDENNENVSSLTMLYFENITELINLREEYEKSRSYAAMILIDSYTELFVKVKDSDKALVTMNIDKLCETFAEEHNAILKKISADSYFCVLSGGELDKLCEEKFTSITDAAHRITVGEHTPVTLSIGVGRGGDNLAQSEKLARQALDMTQGRGGDQVAIKDDKDFTFFGGNSQGHEKNSKVKTRMFALSLVDIIEGSDKVILMGHTWSDLDAIGSAAGLCGAIRCMNKEAYVYANTEATNAKPIISRLKENLEDKDVFIDEAQALEMMTERTLLIITDVNSKDQLDSKSIYEKAAKVVYVDHHRQVVNSIDNSMLTLHEPFASSASEMVAEIIQYFPMEKELSCYYADAMLSGIVLDTKDFVMKTGIRTFEAAAYLKKLGADTVAVKLLFSISIEKGVKRAMLIENVEVYKRCAVTKSSDSSIGVAAAQAADELLNIEGVDASFVIFPKGNGINISARSYGALNVQRLMEKLGGGGHLNMAAAQLADTTVFEAEKTLMKAIDEYSESIS